MVVSSPAGRQSVVAPVPRSEIACGIA